MAVNAALGRLRRAIDPVPTSSGSIDRYDLICLWSFDRRPAGRGGAAGPGSAGRRRPAGIAWASSPGAVATAPHEHRVHGPFTIGFASPAYVLSATEGSRNLAKEGCITDCLG